MTRPPPRSPLFPYTTLFRSIDILVNAAARAGGQAPPPKLDEIDTAAFDDEMHTKVLGYLRCAREVVPSMKQNGWGRSEEHTSELQSHVNLVCRLLLEKKKRT